MKSRIISVSATPTSPLLVNDVIGGNGVTSETAVLSQSSGSTGGTGTYVVNQNTVVTSTTLTATTTVATKWLAMSSAAAGELVKITAQPLG